VHPLQYQRQGQPAKSRCSIRSYPIVKRRTGFLEKCCPYVNDMPFHAAPARCRVGRQRRPLSSVLQSGDRFPSSASLRCSNTTAQPPRRLLLRKVNM